MCEDCGCQEGNARAYFNAQHQHVHHDHDAHEHGHGHSHKTQEIHIHLHIYGTGGAHGASHIQAHVHNHGEHTHTHEHDHSHKPWHNHQHGSSSEANTAHHVHEHPHDHHSPAPTLNHGHSHEHSHSHTHGNDEHNHDHSHDHDHTHPHMQPNQQQASQARTLELGSKILAHNDQLAAHNRQTLQGLGIQAINLISSPGSGKTMLLEKTLTSLSNSLTTAVIVGDQQTDNDAQRLQGKGAVVKQIETKSACHLNAKQVSNIIQEVVTPDTKLLIIENVGNLVCPAAFDLGESHKIALVSVTEGEDKPLKYPVIFSQAPVTIITKIDLAKQCDWDREACHKAIRSLRPDARIIELSAKTGEGMEQWLEYLHSLVE